MGWSGRSRSKPCVATIILSQGPIRQHPRQLVVPLTTQVCHFGRGARAGFRRLRIYGVAYEKLVHNESKALTRYGIFLRAIFVYLWRNTYLHTKIVVV